MDESSLGWIGGLIGAAMGLLGGVIGTCFSVKNTKGPRERAFVIRASLLCWLAGGAFVIAMAYAKPLYFSVLIPMYVIGLGLGVRWWNRRQAEIREEESA